MKHIVNRQQALERSRKDIKRYDRMFPENKNKAEWDDKVYAYDFYSRMITK